MSQLTAPSSAPARSDARGRAVALVALTTLVANLGVWGVGVALGADFVVAPPGAAPMTVGPAMIALTTVLPVALGGVLLWLTSRRWARAVTVLAWVGLAIGIVTAPMPFTVPTSATTAVMLATMHLITGLVWWFLVRRAGVR